MKIYARLTTVALFATIALPSSQALAVDEHFIPETAVVSGYDVVAYHTVGEPTMGSPDYSTTYQGALWHFATEDNLKMFEENPSMYAPAYGGWCAAGVNKGKKVPTKPELWAIVDGQLYLNSSVKAHEKLFLAKTEEVIRKGESNWKTIFATPQTDLE